MQLVVAGILALTILTLGGCQHPDRKDLAQLERFERTLPGPARRPIADEPIYCTARDRICARLWAYKGAACLDLAQRESTLAPTQRAERSRCAHEAFETAIRLLPQDAPPVEARQAMIGLAMSLQTRRGNIESPATRAAFNAAIERAAQELHSVSGGALYAGYFEAGVLENRVLTGEVPAPEQCAQLFEAMMRLPSNAAGDADLEERIRDRRTSIEAARRSPQRRCM